MTDIKIHRPHILNHRAQEQKKVQNSDQYIPDDIKNFAKKQEAVFAELMFKEMSKTNPEFNANSAMNFYNSKLTKERAEALAERSKNGIKDMILDQVYPKQRRTKQSYDAYMQYQKRFEKHKIAMHDKPSRPAIEIANEESGVSHE